MKKKEIKRRLKCLRKALKKLESEGSASIMFQIIPLEVEVDYYEAELAKIKTRKLLRRIENKDN